MLTRTIEETILKRLIDRPVLVWYDPGGTLDALNTYAAEKGLRHNDLFWAVAQAVLEPAPTAVQEELFNHS